MAIRTNGEHDSWKRQNSVDHDAAGTEMKGRKLCCLTRNPTITLFPVLDAEQVAQAIKDIEVENLRTLSIPRGRLYTKIKSSGVVHNINLDCY